MDNVKKAPDSTLHARHVFEEFARIIWYLRSILAALLAIFVLLSAVMYYADGPIEAANGAQRWPHPFGQSSEIFRWNVRGSHAANLIAGSVAKYASSGVRSSRLE